MIPVAPLCLGAPWARGPLNFAYPAYPTVKPLPPRRRKTLSFCLSDTLLNVRVCSPDFAMKALEYRNGFDAVR